MNKTTDLTLENRMQTIENQLKRQGMIQLTFNQKTKDLVIAPRNLRPSLLPKFCRILKSYYANEVYKPLHAFEIVYEAEPAVPI